LTPRTRDVARIDITRILAQMRDLESLVRELGVSYSQTAEDAQAVAAEVI